MLATLDDFYAYGLRADAFASSGRVVAAVDPASDVVTLPMHGFALAAPVRFAVNAVAGALPTGLSATTTYYAIPLGDDLFKVAASAPNALALGPSVDITTAGSGIITAVVSPTPRILRELAACEQIVTAALVAYGGFDPARDPPLEVVQVICQIAAFNLLGTAGLLNPQNPADDMAPIKARRDEAMKTLDRWRAGERLPSAFVDVTNSVDEDAPSGWSDPKRDWSAGGTIQ